MSRKTIELFRPHIPAGAADEVAKTLATKWIGQGPQVDNFEDEFERIILGNLADAVAVNSCTAALHLAFELAGLKPGDLVLCPVFTCTATNMPLVHMGCRIRFVDVDPATLCVDLADLRDKITDEVKAIVFVDYGGLVPNVREIQAIAAEYRIPVIEDAAQSLGARTDSGPVGSIVDYTCFSFQAIKALTTGDGGMLTFRKGEELVDRAKRLRWFGIDRKAKLFGHWENEIPQAGWKYQMTDIAATLGICGLKTIHTVLAHRSELLVRYKERLDGVCGIELIGREFAGTPQHAAWSCTVDVENRPDFERMLTEHGIESGQVHYRNDRYACFKPAMVPVELPNMDSIEHDYHVLPLHMGVSLGDVDYICDCISAGW